MGYPTGESEVFRFYEVLTVMENNLFQKRPGSDISKKKRSMQIRDCSGKCGL